MLRTYPGLEFIDNVIFLFKIVFKKREAHVLHVTGYRVPASIY